MSALELSPSFIKPDGIYALSHSVGPMTLAAKQAIGQDFVKHWEVLGSDAWPTWLSQIDAFCGSIAGLINAKAIEICPQTNLATGFAAFLSAIAKLPKHKHQKVILMHEDAFASMGFVVQGLAYAYQLELVLVKGDPNNQDAWLDALEQNNVLACLFTHVHSNTSIKSDVENLCSLCKQFEAFALVDIAQSVGICPVDVTLWRADAVFGSCVKWLCSGPGAGFMYVKQSLLPYLHPDNIAWFSHQNPFEFDIKHFCYAQDAKRFWGGTPSILPFVTARASIDTIVELGLDKIIAHNRMLKTRLLDLMPDFPNKLATVDSLNKQGGSLCISANNIEKCASNLTNNGVKFDQRGDIFRLSLHVVNNEEELYTIAECF